MKISLPNQKFKVSLLPGERFRERFPRSRVFLVEVRDRNLYKLRFIPVVLNYAQVDLAKGEEFTAICHRMKSLCAPCDTQIMQTAAGLEVKLRNERLNAISKSFQPSF